MVEEVREEEEARHPVGPVLAQRLRKRPEPHRGGGPRGVDPGRLRHVPEQRDGEDEPPRGDREEGEAYRLRRAGQPERVRREGHRHVDREEQPPADVAEGVAERGDFVVSGGPTHGHQQGVVEHDRAGEADRAEGVHGRRGGPVSLSDEPEPGRRGDAERGEHPEVPLARRPAVGKGAEDRRGDQDEHARGGVRDSEPPGADDGIHAGVPVLLEEHREEAGDDRGREHGVRPVVQRPGEDRPAAEQLAHSSHGSVHGSVSRPAAFRSVKAAWIPPKPASTPAASTSASARTRP